MRPPDAQRRPAGEPDGEQVTGEVTPHCPTDRNDLVGALDRVADQVHGLRAELARIADHVTARAPRWPLERGR